MDEGKSQTWLAKGKVQNFVTKLLTKQEGHTGAKHNRQKRKEKFRSERLKSSSLCLNDSSLHVSVFV